MDEQRLANLVGQKNAHEFHPSDPLFVAGTMFDALTKEAVAALGKVVTDAADQIATTAVLSENAAKQRAENIVTDAAKWGSDQIRNAGAEAATRVLAELKAGIEEIRVTRDEAKVWARVSIGAATVAGIAVMAIISWQVWG